MRKFIPSFVVLHAVVIITVWGFILNAQGQTNLGIGFNVGVQKPFCDVPHTGLGPAGEIQFKFLISDRFHLAFAPGFGLLNDGFTYKTFETNLITADLKVNINLFQPGRFNPYMMVGIGVFNFQYNKKKPWALGAPGRDGNRYYDGSFMYGAGMEMMLTEKLAFNAFADYRFTTGDAIDGVERGSKDGYLNTRAGLTYYFKGRKLQKTSGMDDLIADMNEQSGSEISSKPASDTKLDMFGKKVDEYAASESNYSMEQYVQLKSRVDQLNELVTDKERELGDLRNTLDNRSQTLNQLELELQQISAELPAGDADGFIASYESALRKFYERNYNGSMTEFRNLMQRFPNHKLASNCQYWIGECHFGLTQYTEAIEAFRAVFDYGFSHKKDDATLMLGRCYFRLRDLDAAKGYFQELINSYPDSEYVEKAKEWLRRIS